MSQREIFIPISRLRSDPPAGSAPVLDTFGRPLRDLRISVTDHCNFRCTYCMPRDRFGRDHAFLPHSQILRFEEVSRLAGLFHQLGVRKIRLTGGEPLLRRNLDRLVAMLAELPDIDLALTTNGSLLARHAASLRSAGLKRLTVSMDALDDAIFQRMNDADYPASDVLNGIDAAQAAGFESIKVNMVVKRGVNDSQIIPMARHFKGSGHILRMIEYMDVGSSNAWRMDEVVSAREMLASLGEAFSLTPIGRHYPGEVAERWQHTDGGGELGIIAAVTRAFCHDCTRLRLSPEGKLFTCLFATQGHDIAGILRGGATDEQLTRRIARIWREREDRYSELRGAGQGSTQKIEMSYIGG
ncbi:GTP 3',8-cyclase MoaA [Uliginosibacterium gangwonense]|uniref:GTP 3',8-cyclase MoaA n=1 Tax=Uliginosibacterium gangwonense TaxID=392736 RepID=UPI00036E2D23|nr:GTP 3',8-cyclase MoaA [Uliginosibacterium gangwonense]